MSLSDSEEDEEDNNPAPKTKPRTSTSPLLPKPASNTEQGVKVKKGVLISDDEDEDIQKVKPKPSRLKGKCRAVVSDEEDAGRSVRAMMDLDDCSWPQILTRRSSDTHCPYSSSSHSSQSSFCCARPSIRGRRY